MRAPTGNPITQTEHLASKAVDHAYLPDDTVYAPEDGVIDSYMQRGSGTSNAGNCLRLRGATGLHQFAHLYQSYVSPGQTVVKGQRLAQMGDTGYAFGRHLHYWVETPNGYVYPPNLYSEPFTNQGGIEMFQNIQEVTEAYIQMRGVPGSDAEMRPWIGQSKQRWIQLSTLETNSQRQQLADVRQALENERNKPPKEVIKEVTKIIEKPVEVIKEVPVYVHDEETKQNVSAILKLVKSIKGLILNLFKRK
jgi:hypothetical protein